MPSYEQNEKDRAARIKEGDTVLIAYPLLETGNWEDKARIIHAPSGAGDLWQIQLEDGTVWAINPYHSEFVGFRKGDGRDELEVPF